MIISEIKFAESVAIKQKQKFAKTFTNCSESMLREVEVWWLLAAGHRSYKANQLISHMNTFIVHYTYNDVRDLDITFL